MIIRGGENIYPREIEEFLYTMPGIEDAQVVGVPDAKYGEVVGAFVRRSAAADIGESDVQEFARARLARYKAPKHVFFVEEFPLTASGKVQKYKLRELAQRLVDAQKDTVPEATEAAAATAVTEAVELGEAAGDGEAPHEGRAQ